MNKKVLFTIAILLSSSVLISCREDIDPGAANTLAGIFSLLIEFFSVIILALSGFAIAAAGFWLIYAGYTGEIELFISGDGLGAKLINASPGIVLIVIGAFLIWKSKPNIRIKKD